LTPLDRNPVVEHEHEPGDIQEHWPGRALSLAVPVYAHDAVLELDLRLSADQVLEECRRRGIVARSERELAGRHGSHHWHLALAGRSGTLELNEWHGRVWVKVHPLRDGGWASDLAQELAALKGT
jgi:hypothetical protein